jgi:hypothetical protein
MKTCLFIWGNKFKLIMDLVNFTSVLVAALATFPIGFIWYNPKVFGTAWMHSIGVTSEEEMKKGANMIVIFGMSLVFALMLSTSLIPLVIHQMGIGSLLAEYNLNANSDIQLILDGKAIEWKDSFRTFKHGMFHGALGAIFIAMPIIGTNALFERRGFKYIMINTGYWLLNMMVMGGIICAWK